MNEDLVKGIEAMGRSVGLGGLARAVLRDHEAPDPVVPPDLHLVRPVTADADGNIHCLYCGRAVKWEAAQMVGSAGYECGSCQHYNQAEPPVLDTKIGPRKWPWIVAGVLALGAGIGFWQYVAAGERARLAEQYPIEASDDELALFEASLDRWSDDNIEKLTVVIDNPPAIKSLKLGAACDHDISKSLQFRSDKDSQKEIAHTLHEMVKSAERGRFAHIFDRKTVVEGIASPVLALAFHEQSEAKLDDVDGETVFLPGVQAGTVHLFDADGTLLCAGAFEAESSRSVRYTKERYDWDSDQEMREMTSDDRDNARWALSSDLEGQTWNAIVGSLKQVR